LRADSSKSTFALVKQVLALILSLVLLSQSFLPCMDGAVHIEGNEAKYEMAKAADTHGSAEDACPPFCQCNCCAGFTINHTVASYPELVINHAAATCGYLSGPPIQVALPIWQPPQLS
jgi:hypothetical protein